MQPSAISENVFLKNQFQQCLQLERQTIVEVSALGWFLGWDKLLFKIADDDRVIKGKVSAQRLGFLDKQAKARWNNNKNNNEDDDDDKLMQHTNNQ